MAFDVETEVKKLEDSIQALMKKMDSNLDEQKREIKAHGVSTAGTAAQIEKLDNQFKQHFEDLSGLKSQFEQFATTANRPGFSVPEDLKTIGEQWIGSAAHKEFKDKKQRNSDLLEIKGFFPGMRHQALALKWASQAKDISAASEGALRTVFATQRLQEMFLKPHRVQRIRDIIPVLPTTQGAIEFVRQTGYAANAAMVLEGNLKPLSGITYEAETRAIRTLAHWTPVARQLIDDVEGLRAWIDLELVLGLKDAEDTQLLFGDGTGANLHGLMVDPNVQTYKWSNGAGKDTKIDAIRRAITKVTAAYFVANAVVIHPIDWEDIELTKNSLGSYIWVNPSIGGVKQLWRLDVIETTAMTPGDFLVGAFDRGCTLWDREQAGVRIADQHADFFIRNQFVILAEERLALTIYRPEAFVSGQFDHAPASGASGNSGGANVTDLGSGEDSPTPGSLTY